MKRTKIINIPAGRIVGIKKQEAGNYNVILEVEENEDDILVLFEASKLQSDDEFLNHIPRTKNEKRYKKQLLEVIKKGVNDFYHPKYIPSFDKNNGVIFFANDNEADFFAIGYAIERWPRMAEATSYSLRSRLGTKDEYVAAVGVLIKTLVAEGVSIPDAWDFVCNNVEKLVEYWENDYKYSPNGSKELFGFQNMLLYKIVTDDENQFWLVGSRYKSKNFLTKFHRVRNIKRSGYFLTGWMIFEK